MASYHLQAVASHLVRCDESANVNTRSTPLRVPKMAAYSFDCARFSRRIPQSCEAAARSWKHDGTNRSICSPKSYVANTYVAL